MGQNEDWTKPVRPEFNNAVTLAKELAGLSNGDQARALILLRQKRPALAALVVRVLKGLPLVNPGD